MGPGRGKSPLLGCLAKGKDQIVFGQLRIDRGTSSQKPMSIDECARPPHAGQTLTWAAMLQGGIAVD